MQEGSLNPLNAELNPICHLPALLAHLIFHVSRIRVKSPLPYPHPEARPTLLYESAKFSFHDMKFKT
jgi:hypothetical protein